MAMTWTLSAGVSDASGRYGSSAWVERQVTTPSTMMMASGTPQTTASISREWLQSGV